MSPRFRQSLMITSPHISVGSTWRPVSKPMDVERRTPFALSLTICSALATAALIRFGCPGAGTLPGGGPTSKRRFLCEAEKGEGRSAKAHECTCGLEGQRLRRHYFRCRSYSLSHNLSGSPSRCSSRCPSGQSPHSVSSSIVVQHAGKVWLRC